VDTAEVNLWPDIRIVGPIVHRRGARYSSQVEVHAPLSRPTKIEWALLFEQALKLDPADRDASDIRAQMMPMVWATVSAERAETVDGLIREAVDVANLRYRTHWLPTLSPDEVRELIDEALTFEQEHPTKE
jgi:hypothetical protein